MAEIGKGNQNDSPEIPDRGVKSRHSRPPFGASDLVFYAQSTSTLYQGDKITNK